MTLPENSNTGPPASSDWKLKPGVIVLFFAVAVAFQWLTGAYQSEFGSEPDEAAHYVTGLMVRDYVAAGFPGNPLSYARNYYDHYPKVALGHWPPFFYALQAAWTLVFSPSRVSVLLLMALLTALIATVVFAILKNETGFFKALPGGWLFLALPLVQTFSGAIMTEIPVALLVLVAAVFFGRYLDRERTADALWFGLVASLAILTKLSGLVLALVPPIALVLTGKFHLLKRASFWWPAAITGAVCGPVAVWTARRASEGWAGEGWGWAYTSGAIPYYLQELHWTAGSAVLLFMVIGLVTKLHHGGRGAGCSGVWSAVAALFFGVLLEHMILPVSYEARHLVPALSAVAVFAVVGVDCVAGWLSRWELSRRLAFALAFGLLAVVFVVGTFRVPQKGYQGFGAVAESLLQNPEAGRAVFLVASDARGEGMFISELAMREKRPGHIVRRGSKELASSSWGGSDYRSRFTDEASLVASLRTNSVRYLVLDTSVPPNLRKDYHDLLSHTVERNPMSFALAGRFPCERAGAWSTNGILLYRLIPE